MPFYYIEYAIAQLGAIALCKNYREDSAKALQHYKETLSLGYTCSLSKMYATAGVKLDFSREYITSLVAFLQEQLNFYQS